MNIENLPEASGIYMIQNMINGHAYIGQSVNIKDRIKHHHLHDYLNENNTQYNTKFYQALRKYGIDNFEIIILELCNKEELDKKEIYYIGKFNTFHNGYNSTEGGQFWTPNIHSEETEEKRRITREKNKSLQSENHPRAKLSNDEVIRIRQRYINGESVENIYKDYENKYSNIGTLRRIILGETYKTVGNIPDKKAKQASRASFTNENLIREIRKRYSEEKTTYSKLAKEYNVNPSIIQRIVLKEGYYGTIL